jgi:hypothetical protein
MRGTLTGLALLKQIRKVRLGRSHTLANLNQRPLIQLHLVAVLYLIVGPPVVIANVVPGFIVDHDAFVKRVVSEIAIVPAFRLSTQIMCVETAKLDHRRGDGGRGRARRRGRGRGCASRCGGCWRSHCRSERRPSLESHIGRVEWRGHGAVTKVKQRYGTSCERVEYE